MTENKRFTWKNVYGWHTGAFLVVMNGLDAKNKRLKQENEQLTQDRIEMFIRERDTKNEWRKLKEENEQLKKENKELNDIIDTIEKDYENRYGMSIRNADWFTAW